MWLRVCVRKLGEIRTKGFFESSGELGPKCPVGSGAPAAQKVPAPQHVQRTGSGQGGSVLSWCCATVL